MRRARRARRVHPGDDDLEAEIRGHLALSIKERIERGEDPESARRAALKEFGNVTLTRDSMRAVWRYRWLDAAEALGRDVRFAVRSLLRAKGLAATVIITLALGIGANAAIFSVVRGVLLRPLVNRDEDRLIYVRQSAPGLGAENTAFSVPEVNDFKSRATTIGTFGDFSSVEFTMTGLGGEPRTVRAGVVNGSFFDVMGLRPVLGRLLNTQDDGPQAAGVAVLTQHFWTTALNRDPLVVGKTIRLGPRTATVVGVLEPSVPYPADTEIIANVVTSPHHLGATMVTSRTHRMTELFGRLAPGASFEAARADLTAVHAAMMREHPEAYAESAHVQLRVTKLRDQIAAPARTILLLLLAAAAVVFVIACSNVANLILARSVRREGELAVRAALGAGDGALRRTLLAESLVLCGAGAVLGVALSGPFVAIVSRYAARFSVRALDVTVDSSVLWVGAGLAIAAAVLLAYVPRLPSTYAPAGLGLASGSVRITPSTNRRLRIFATAQIAFSFVLLAGAGTLLATLVSLQTARTGFDMRQVLAFDVPMSATGFASVHGIDFPEAMRRISALPDVVSVSAGMTVPWRDAGAMPRFQFTVEGYTPADGEENPHARFRVVAPRFFAVLGVPIVAGREFTDDDRAAGEPVVIVSRSVAQLFPGGGALNQKLWWTDSLASLFGKSMPSRIVGIAADVDDENVVPAPSMAVYVPTTQMGAAERLFVRAAGDPYRLVPAVTRVIHEMSPDQAVERAATLEDVRAQVLSPERLNAFVFSGFAGIALLIAVVGVAGVLAFSVSARTREFGVRLAVGASPAHLLARVLAEGIFIAALGIAAGAAGGYALSRVAVTFVENTQLPGAMPVAGAAAVLIAAAVVASLTPAARASRVDVLQGCDPSRKHHRHDEWRNPMNRTCSLFLLLILMAAGLSAAGPEPKFKTPRTIDGQPDLQGVWNFSTHVPLQRPASFADKKFFTREELEEQSAAIRKALGAVVKFAPVEDVGLDWIDDKVYVNDLRTSLITYPDNGRMPKLLEGVRRVPGVEDFIAILADAKGGPPPGLLSLLAMFGGGKNDGHEDFGAAQRCLFGASTPLVPGLGDNYVQIVQSRDHVVLLRDETRRIVALDGKPRAGSSLQNWSGESRGHWEGETLVVETRNFNGRTPSFNGAGTSRDKVVTERFARGSKDGLEYEAIIVDPKTFEDKIMLSFPMAKVDARIYESACHEGNYSLSNILSGARAEERRAMNTKEAAK